MGQDDLWSNICHFYELTVILQDFYQFFNPSMYLPWSLLLRGLCKGTKITEGWFSQYLYKKDSRQGIRLNYLKRPELYWLIWQYMKELALVSALIWLPSLSLLLPVSALCFGFSYTSWQLHRSCSSCNIPGTSYVQVLLWKWQWDEFASWPVTSWCSAMLVWLKMSWFSSCC